MEPRRPSSKRISPSARGARSTYGRCGPRCTLWATCRWTHSPSALEPTSSTPSGTSTVRPGTVRPTRRALRDDRVGLDLPQLEAQVAQMVENPVQGGHVHADP